MTLPLTLKRRISFRLSHLPAATSLSHVCAVWVRTDGRLLCKVCGRP